MNSGPQYILRLDDACPTMRTAAWEKIEASCDRHNIKPIVAVIPDNQDSSLYIENPNPDFWDKMAAWQHKGWHIALHGHTHVYTTTARGLVPMNPRSEFAGVSLSTQTHKIRTALSICEQHNISPSIWCSPSHSFDRSTLTALQNATTIRLITDGIATFPFTRHNFFWIPQQNWRFRTKSRGVWTTCLHPSTISQERLDHTLSFMASHADRFVQDFAALQEHYGKRRHTLVDRCYAFTFFLRRYLLDEPLTRRRTRKANSEAS